MGGHQGELKHESRHNKNVYLSMNDASVNICDFVSSFNNHLKELSACMLTHQHFVI